MSSEKLKEYIETVEDQNTWKNFLMKQPQEQLVELIIDKMARDNYFLKEVYAKLVEENKSFEVIRREYEENVKMEMSMRAPSVDYLETISEKLMDVADNPESVLEKLMIYTTIIFSLDAALENGAGYEEENEFLLFEIMDECRDDMILIIEEKSETLSIQEYSDVYNFLEDKSQQYNSVDGENRIQSVFDKLSEINKKRTRIGRDGGYVRGKDYYANL